MPGKVISVVNMKGGVGKTTLSVCLAEALAVMAQKKVLVADLDSQASCSYAFLGRQRFAEAKAEKKNSYALFNDLHLQIGAQISIAEDVPSDMPHEDLEERLEEDQIAIAHQISHPISELIVRNASALQPTPTIDILPAVPELQLLEQAILYKLGQFATGQENPGKRIGTFLNSHLNTARMDYDFIVVDCPPGISSFTAAAIQDSDIVLAPVTPDYLSELGLQVFAETVLRPLKARLARPFRAQAVFNRYQAIPAHDMARASIQELIAKMDDVLCEFPKIIEQAPELQAAVSGADFPGGIREKYGSVVLTLEDMLNCVLDLTEKDLGEEDQPD